MGDLDVSGAGAVGVAINSTVITGDGNVILRIDGQTFSQVPVPDSVAGVERLLFESVAGPDSALVGSWLRPDAGVIEPEPRPEVETLVDWCSSGRGPLVRLLVGAGGQGKTHLAGQVCARLRGTGWLAGFVRLPSSNWRAVRLADLAGGGATGQRALRELRRVPELTAAVHAAAQLQVPTLIVVDYAENVGPVVAELLDTIADGEAGKWVRLLLLARTDADWFRELAVDHRLHDWVHPTPMRLGALSEAWDGDRIGLAWATSIDLFTQRARQHGFAVPGGVAAVPPARFATTLDLYATALVAVLDAANGSEHVDPVDGDALAGVLRHEHRQVSVALRAAGLHLNEVQHAWALSAVTLTVPATQPEAVEIVSRIPVLTDIGRRQQCRLVEVLCRLYPDGSRERVWQAPKPDRLADINLLELAMRTPSQRQWLNELIAVCGGDDAGAAGHATTVLHRCLSTPDPAELRREGLALVRTGLAGLLDHCPGVYVSALVVVDPAGFESEIVDAVSGSRGVVGLTVAQVRELDALLHLLGFATTRTGVAVAVSQRLVEATRVGDGSDPEQLNRYAVELTNLSIRLAEIGRRHDGLAAVVEAVAVYWELVEVEPETYLPKLASSLTNMSVDLAAVGRYEEGLTAAEKAVAVRRLLVEADRAVHVPSLASSLNNLAICLDGLGRGDESWAAVDEATAILRELAEVDPVSYLPDLAKSLTNLSIGLGLMGRHNERVAAAVEAVSIRRKLAEANRAAHLPSLAKALHNLAVGLYSADRPVKGLAVAVESTAVHRELIEAGRDVYLPNFGASLNTLAVSMCAMGRLEEGLAVAEESIAVHRELVETNPATYLPVLVQLLNLLSSTLNRLERAGEARVAKHEADRLSAL
ncbi:tetratricopeptide repeat protein [Micromonospora luteifusca]|uniref:tetratricopeptide repeat protein n=1 Tax=Micromonospora luteifusca TaxID=709860 RepID=UPI0033A7965A